MMPRNPREHQIFLEFAAVASGRHREIARGLEARREVAGDGRHILDDDADARLLRVQRNAVAEQEEQDQRQHEGDQNAARIADDLKAFLANERDKSKRRGADCGAFAGPVIWRPSFPSPARVR